MRALLIFAALFLLVVNRAPAQETAEPYQRMLDSQKQVTEHLVREARRITDTAAKELASKQTWEPVRDKRRREMLDMLGLDPLPPKTPLNVQITETLDKPGYTIEKIAFESLPGVFATTNLYIPKKREGPLPTVIYVCGHAYSPQGNKTMYQRHPIAFAKHGYVSMIIDSIQIAETFALHHGVLNNEMYDWYSRGYTPAGVEVWNVIRALDYLSTRPEVDKERFGITGRSGGAAMSWFSAAVDERIKAVAPVMGTSTYAANVADNTQRRHCDCMFTINTHMHDMMHQGALIAPRPLYMMHGRQDRLFPIPGYKEFEDRIGKLYASYGAADKFKNLEVDTGHKDSDLLRGEALHWFDRFLKGIPERELDLDYSHAPPEQLAVFSGKPPARAQNFRVHETFTAGPELERPATAAVWAARRDDLMRRLDNQVFQAFPADPVALNVRVSEGQAGGSFETLHLDSEESVSVSALYRPAENPGNPALLYIASNGEDRLAMRDTLRQVWGSKENALLVVYPRGVGEVAWDKKFHKDTLRNAMHTGRTVDSMRVWDVMRAAEVLRSRSGGEDVVTLGIGDSGVLGLYAALLDEEIKQVMLINPPSTHRDGPVLLNVSRYTDLPEVAGLLAPRRLVFYGLVPEAYGLTRDIYSLVGKVDYLSLTMSIRAALNGRYDHNFSSGL
jgi:dienelactone hydrolase